MALAAARAIADAVGEDKLNPSVIVPSVFDARVAPAVAAAVRAAAKGAHLDSTVGRRAVRRRRPRSSGLTPAEPHGAAAERRASAGSPGRRRHRARRSRPVRPASNSVAVRVTVSRPPGTSTTTTPVVQPGVVAAATAATAHAPEPQDSVSPEPRS